MRYSLLAGMLSLALLAGGADAAGAKAVKVTPTISVTGAAVKGKKVSFAVYHALGIEVQGCSGKITMSHQLSKKTTKSWSASLKQSSVACAATVHGTLPKSKFGKKVKFSIKFPGNSKIKKFSLTKSLTLSPPPPPTTPTPGPSGPPASTGPQAFGKWTAEDPLDSNHQFNFTIKSPDYAVPGITTWFGGNTVMFCGAGYPATVVNFHWNKAFALGGQVGKVEYNDNTGFAHDLLYTLNFSFANAHQGSGSMTAVGGYDMGGAGGVQNCSVSFNFNLNWTGPEF